MKKVIILCTIGCVLAILAACGGKENKVKVSHISYTDCKSYTYKDAKSDPIWGAPDSVSVYYDNGTVYITHYNVLVNCGFTLSGILVDVDVDGSTVTISEHENPKGPQADCMCATDNSFHLDNVPQGTYTLVFTNWYPEPYSQTYTF